MAVLEFPIKKDYVSSWGSWECVREVMQNGLDEDERGFKLTVDYQDGYLKVANHGADMDVKALLIGHTDKSENERLRGQHGEGLTSVVS